MADETRTPEEVAREWLRRQGLEVGRHLASDDVAALADLIRQERDDAFAAAFLATARYATADVKGVDDHWKRRDAFEVERRLAVEGRSDG